MSDVFQLPFIQEAIRIGTALLIPLLPAYVLYKALPSDAFVNGPLHGFKVQLGGAFAGYFTLVLVVLLFWRPGPKYELWEVKGQVRCQECGRLETGRLGLSLRPPNQNITDDGMFEIQIARAPGMNGEFKFPTLVIEHPEFETVSVDLNEGTPIYNQTFRKLAINKWSREITIEGNLSKAIALEKKRPYSPQGAAPQPVALSAIGEGTP